MRPGVRAGPVRVDGTCMVRDVGYSGIGPDEKVSASVLGYSLLVVEDSRRRLHSKVHGMLKHLDPKPCFLMVLRIGRGLPSKC